MSKKILQGILFLAVCGIWSLVIYRFMKSNDSDDTVITLPITAKANRQQAHHAKNTLSLDYQDPFLKEQRQPLRVKPEHHAAQTRQGPPKKSEVVVEVLWPDLVYNGLIKNKQSGKEHGLITINSTNRIVERGEHVESFLVVDVTNQTIVLRSASGEKRTWSARK